MDKFLIVIVGPTAIGKSALAINLAKELNTEIISADSRQFYTEMNIGTAKPSDEELTAAKHHFINSLSVTEDFNVGDFEVQGLQVLKQLFSKYNSAILVGGSGLYINAITQGFDNLPTVNPEIREKLNSSYQEKGLNYLQEQLKQLDSEYYLQVDKNNPQRIIRALEVCLSTGLPFSSFRQNNKTFRPFKCIKIGLNTEREVLYNQINIRVDKMIVEGLIEEVEQLLPFKNLNSLQTVGYSEVFDYLEGKCALTEAVEIIKQNTRRFAKRQLTWFRKDKEIIWFEPNDYELISEFVKENIQNQA